MKKIIALALMSLGFAWPATPALAQKPSSLTAPEIIAKLSAKYAGLTSMTVTGQVITDVGRAGTENTKATSRFSIQLGRPALYRIEWSQVIADSYKKGAGGAAWSSGNGDFLYLGDKKRSIEGGMDMALGSATGVSGGVASTLPPLFFRKQTNEMQSLGNLALLPEEKIGNDLCQVVSGELNGLKLILWINKADSCLKQKRMVLGGEMKFPEMSDDDVKKSLKAIGQEATPEAIAQLKETMKSMQAMSSKMKGSITETYETFEANPSLTRDSFESEVKSKN